MKNLIINYINNLNKENIIYFANKNNLKYSKEEIDFVYGFLKKDATYYINNPQKFNLENYKNNFSNENYNFINNLLNKYKRYL